MNKLAYFNIFKELVKIDLNIFKQNFKDKIIDLTIWVVLTLFVTRYILPYFGVSNTYGILQLGGVLAAVGLFESYPGIIDIVSDVEGDKIINYSLTLPIPSYLVILSKVTYFAITYLLLTICVFPIGVLCLWGEIDLASIDYLKLFIAFIVTCGFYGSFAMWAASITKNMQTLGTVWSRYIFPMWFLGGFQFSWKALYSVFPIIAYLNLFNPMIYITEAIRSTILNPNDYLNFWLCIMAILFFTVTFFIFGFKTLKKRLDFI